MRARTQLQILKDNSVSAIFRRHGVSYDEEKSLETLT